MNWWSRLKTLWADEPPIPEPRAASAPPVMDSRGEDPKSPREWLTLAQSCKAEGDREGAVTAFRTAALLFWDEKKAPQARASLKLAIELAPRDQYLLAELKNFQSTDPLHDGPTRRMTLQEAQRLSLQEPPQEEDVELPDFAQPTVVDLDLLGLRGTR